MTDGGVGTAVPEMVVWLSPPLSAIWVAAPAVPVAVNVTTLLAAPTVVAVRLLGPACGPSVQLPTRPTPSGPVTASGLVRLPPPDATVNVTVAPATGAPLE